MPQVSRRKLSKTTEQKLVESLNLVLASIGNKDSMINFLNALLTDTEKIMLAKRLAIIVMLEQGSSDSDVANALNVTRVTVAKLRYFYEARGSGYKIALEKIKTDKQLQDVNKLLLQLTRYTIRAAGGYVKPSILD